MDQNEVNASLRGHNRQAILRLIRQSGAISRVQLARRLGLSRSTVTENITPLLQSGVVHEVGVATAQSSGGRRPVLLRVNGGYRFFVAAELGLREPIFALSDLNGSLLLRRTVSLPDDAPYDLRFRVTRNTIRQLLAEGGVPEGALASIALSSPGAYSAAAHAFLLNPEFENWNVHQLIRDLEAACATEVFWVNDINAATVGEFHQGAGRGRSSLLFMGCGMGVGLGMVLNGALYTGTSGSAGEIARVKVTPMLRPLRTSVEIPSLVAFIRKRAPQTTRAAFGCPAEQIDFGAVVRLWQEEDPFVRATVANVGRTLGEVLAFALSLLNCECVVFGGDYLVFESQLLPIINEVLRQEAFDPVQAVSSSLRREAGLYGLLSMASEALLDRIAIER